MFCSIFQKKFTGPLVKNVNGYVRLVGVVSGGAGINCTYTIGIPALGNENRQRYANVPHYTQWIMYAFTLLLS